MDTIARFRQLALALPGAVESSHMGAADFRLTDRIFATPAYAASGLATLKLIAEQQAEWIAEAPVDVIEDALRVSYNNVLMKQPAKKRTATRRPSQA